MRPMPRPRAARGVEGGAEVNRTHLYICELRDKLNILELRAEARADLERRTVELLERLLRGELDPRGVESIRGAPTTEDCHAELRALRAEWEAVRS